MDIVRETNPLKEPDIVIPKYTKEDFLSVVYMSEEKYDVLEAVLKNKLNIILEGAPGEYGIIVDGKSKSYDYPTRPFILSA